MGGGVGVDTCLVYKYEVHGIQQLTTCPCSGKRTVAVWVFDHPVKGTVA